VPIERMLAFSQAARVAPPLVSENVLEAPTAASSVSEKQAA